MGIFKKAIVKTHTGEMQELEAIETWTVKWMGFKCDSSIFADYQQKYQSFPKKETAILFSNQLKDAYKLIGAYGARAKVECYMENNGL